MVVTNCTFSGNEGGSSGGGAIYNYNSTAVLTNCILWGNTATNGDQIWNSTATPTISYSDIEGSGGSAP